VGNSSSEVLAEVLDRKSVFGSARKTGRTSVLWTLLVSLLWCGCFALGLLWATHRAHAEGAREATSSELSGTSNSKSPRVIYPERTELDFEGTQIQGEIRNPGEFYFVRRPEEKFDSLLKRRKNFHPQMLRDAVLSR
jgi:hypothetical protein